MTERENTIVLTDEEGNEQEFEVIDLLEVDDSEYAILLPVDEEDDQAMIFRIDVDENGEDILVEVEDDDEWERVAQYWEELMGEEPEEDEEEKEK